MKAKQPVDYYALKMDDAATGASWIAFADVCGKMVAQTVSGHTDYPKHFGNGLFGEGYLAGLRFQKPEDRSYSGDCYLGAFLSPKEAVKFYQDKTATN